MEKVAYFTLMDDERFYRVLNVSVYFFSYVFYLYDGRHRSTLNRSDLQRATAHCKRLCCRRCAVDRPSGCNLSVRVRKARIIQ